MSVFPDLSLAALRQSAQALAALPVSTPESALAVDAAQALASCPSDEHELEVCLGRLLLAHLLWQDVGHASAAADVLANAPSLPVGNAHAWALDAYASVPSTALAKALRRLCVWHPEVQELHLTAVSRQLALEAVHALTGLAPKFLPSTALEVSVGHDCWEVTPGAQNFLLVELLVPGEGGRVRHRLTEWRFPVVSGATCRTLKQDLQALRGCIDELTKEARRRV